MTVRENIISYFVTNLTQIREANGYETDVKKVYDWHPNPAEAEKMPLISVEDVADNPVQEGEMNYYPVNATGHKLQLEVKGIVEGEDASSQVRKLSQDMNKWVKAHIEKIEQDFHPCKVKWLGDRFEKIRESKTFAAVIKTFEIEYITEEWES